MRHIETELGIFAGMIRRRRTTATTQCGGCGRNIDIATHRTEPPRSDVPDKCIAWRKVQQGQPLFTVLCICGHFTVQSHLDGRHAGLPDSLETEMDPSSPHPQQQ
jgi:hypothetical protein